MSTAIANGKGQVVPSAQKISKKRPLASNAPAAVKDDASAADSTRVSSDAVKRRKVEEPVTTMDAQLEDDQLDDSKQATLSEESVVTENTTFVSLGVTEALAQSCTSLGWKRPTEIQAQTIPLALQGRDVIALAETGSGKTGAFVIPVLQDLLERPQGLFALVLAPTRELAFQISEQFEALGASIGVRCAVIIGGVDMVDQAIALSKKPHIVVATPGRIVDHLENTKGFNLRNLRYLILDEADRLLDMDFETDIDKIISVIPRDRHTYLFSATMTSKVAKLQRASLTNPARVEVSKKYQTVRGLIQQYIFIPAKYKDCYLAFILNELAGNSVMVFTSTCDHTQRLSIMLRHLGFPAIPLHGKMSQPKRLGALNKFKSGDRAILIATDVASRGLDIPSVDVVLNFDIPTHSKDYIHRVGRTARAGRSGRAVTLVTQYDVELFQRIEQLIGKKMDPFPAPENAVMLLLERVTDAQRIAALELRDLNEKRRGGGRDDADADGPAGDGAAGGSGSGAGGHRPNKFSAAKRGNERRRGSRGRGRGGR